jgi:hypothetical protein
VIRVELPPNAVDLDTIDALMLYWPGHKPAGRPASNRVTTIRWWQFPKLRKAVRGVA